MANNFNNYLLKLFLHFARFWIMNCELCIEKKSLPAPPLLQLFFDLAH